MPFSTALDGSLPVLWPHMPQTICKKSVTRETSTRLINGCCETRRVSSGAKAHLFRGVFGTAEAVPSLGTIYETASTHYSLLTDCGNGVGAIMQPLTRSSKRKWWVQYWRRERAGSAREAVRQYGAQFPRAWCREGGSVHARLMLHWPPLRRLLCGDKLAERQ
jgi:hypothetical protein